MKLNLISDIHAHVNDKTHIVEYAIPYNGQYNSVRLAFNRILRNISSEDTTVKRYISQNSEINCKTFSDVLSFLDMISADLNSFGELSISTQYDRYHMMNAIVTWMYEAKCHNIVFKDLNKILTFMNTYLYSFNPSRLEPADYLIIAGDLGLSNSYDAILDDIRQKTEGKFKKILHIPGNHDHWWIGNSRINEKRPSSVDFGKDMTKFLDGEYLFLGCTLWTPVSDYETFDVQQLMNDYQYIPGKFSVFSSREQYRIQSEWLKSQIFENKDKKIIVFTHHQPFSELISEKYANSRVNAAFAVLDHSLDDINKHNNIVLWHCGHTHEKYDGNIHNVHVVRNPIGYSSLYGFSQSEVEPLEWYNKIIEI